MPASNLVIQAVIAATLSEIVILLSQEKAAGATSDVTGHAVYDLQTEQFKLRNDLALTRLLMADEVNRAAAKTQAALLAAMQERQITLEGRALSIEPFMVLTTQKPY